MESLKFENVTVSLELVTPEIARDWLLRRAEIRKVRPKTVAKYSWDMSNGTWKFAGDPIRFNNEGVLVDGNHRLTSVVKSGTSQSFIVVRGLDPDACLYIDDPLKRMTHESFNLVGMATDASAVATMKALFRDARTASTVTNSQLLDLYAKNRRAIEFATSCFPIHTKHLSIASVKAAWAKAYYYYPSAEEREDLRRASNILVTGFYEEERDRSMVVLRNRLLTNLNHTGRSGTFKVWAHRCSQRAIQAFMAGEVISQLRVPKNEIFPVKGLNEEGLPS